MTFSADLITPAMEIHKHGCADVARTMRTHRTKSNEQAEHVETYSADTLIDLIRELDTEMAGYFGQEPYTEDAATEGCWTVATSHVAPCFPSMKGLVYDGSAAPVERSYLTSRGNDPRPRSLQVAAVEVTAYPCKGKWSVCGGKNEKSSKIGWNLCPDCTDKRAAAMAAQR